MLYVSAGGSNIPLIVGVITGVIELVVMAVILVIAYLKMRGKIELSDITLENLNIQMPVKQVYVKEKLISLDSVNCFDSLVGLTPFIMVFLTSI